MRLFVILTVVVCIVSAKAEAAGFRFIDIPADANGPALRGAVWPLVKSVRVALAPASVTATTTAASKLIWGRPR